VAKPVRRGPIPLDRHEAILAKARKDHDDAVAAVNAQLAELAWAREPNVRESLEAFRIAEERPEVFAKVLLGDERIGAIIRQLVGAEAPAQPAAAPAAAPKASGDGRPAPDKLNADGTLGYTEEGIEKLLEWNRSQAAAEAEERISKKFEERFGPMEQRFRSEQKLNEARTRQRGVLETARKNWPHFAKHEDAMKQYLAQNPSAQLDDAYRAVVIPALQADRDTMRAELLAELNKRPEAAAVPRPGPAAAPNAVPEGVDPLEAIIARNAAKLER
jgi:hypothetical protein